MRLNSELDIIDAFTLFFFQANQIVFRREVVSTAMIRYELFQYPWGSVGGIAIRKLNAETCDIHYEYPPGR